MNIERYKADLTRRVDTLKMKSFRKKADKFTDGVYRGMLMALALLEATERGPEPVLIRTNYRTPKEKYVRKQRMTEHFNQSGQDFKNR